MDRSEKRRVFFLWVDAVDDIIADRDGRNCSGQTFELICLKSMFCNVLCSEHARADTGVRHVLLLEQT